MAIVTKEERTEEPMTKGYVFFGRKRPKNFEENLAGQQDPTLQAMIWEWYREKDPELRKQKWQEAMEYWAKRRVELGFRDKEE